MGNNDSSAYCVKCGKLLFLCGCSQLRRELPGELYCAKCGEPTFRCECADAGCVGCGECFDQGDEASYHDITICMICEAIIDDDAVPGDGIYFCENCGDAVCSKCAQPALDEAGEIVFVCKICLDKNKNDTCG